MNEHFPLFVTTDNDLEMVGSATREALHSRDELRHGSVLILALREGTTRVFLHRRSDQVRNSPNCLDVFGGHASFENGFWTTELAEIFLTTALREAREEILAVVDGEPHVPEVEDFVQIGRLGEWRCDSPQNLETTTAYLLKLPQNAHFTKSPFYHGLSAIQWLDVVEMEWADLLAAFARKPESFADGIARILQSERGRDLIAEELLVS